MAREELVMNITEIFDKCSRCSDIYECFDVMEANSMLVSLLEKEIAKAREEGVKMGMENAWGIVSALLDTLDVDKNEEEIRILTGINQLFDTEITKLALKFKDNK